jgi:hypothetical protein
MPKQGGIPEKTNDFHHYLQTVVPHLDNNRERLYIPDDLLMRLNLQFGEKSEVSGFPENSWNDLFAKRSSPLTCTTLIKQLVRAKRLEIDKLLRTIYRQAIGHMNAADLAVTGRKKMPEKRSKAPLADRAPNIHIRSQSAGIITLRFTDPKFPTLRRNPPQFRKVRLQYEVDMEDGKTRWEFITTGKWFYRLRLPEFCRGKKIRISACYLNVRGSGPMSDRLQAFII